jgi:predicted TIM-barrel fold metal-dependent hydrolase
LPFTSIHYDFFWAAAQELEMPVGLHVNTGYSSKERRDKHGMDIYRYSVNGKTGEITHALFDIIFSGVLERFPDLKIVSAENEIGWIPFWLDQADKFFERYRSIEDLAISKRPTEYFERQVFATFFNDRVGACLLSHWGLDNYMWSNDYPHGGSMTWPYSGEVIARDLGHLPVKDRVKLLSGNVARLYKMNVAST